VTRSSVRGDTVPIAARPVLARPAPTDNARPTGDVVEDLVDDIVGDDVEEVLSINEIAQRPSNEIEVRRGGLVGSVFRIRHFGPSLRLETQQL
jgi:hypothetical protein